MAKHEPVTKSKENVKNRTGRPDAEIDKKMNGMRWKKLSGNAIDFITGSFDETMFNGENEFDPPLTTERNQVLRDLWIEFHQDMVHLDNNTNKAIKDFEKGPQATRATAVYMRVYSEWIDLMINHEHNGVPPATTLTFLGLHVILDEHNAPAVSDTKDFTNFELIADIEKGNVAFLRSNFATS